MASTSSLVNDSILPLLFTFTFDSGSDTHLLTFKAVRSLLSSQELSSLQVFFFSFFGASTNQCQDRALSMALGQCGARPF